MDGYFCCAESHRVIHLGCVYCGDHVVRRSCVAWDPSPGTAEADRECDEGGVGPIVCSSSELREDAFEAPSDIHFSFLHRIFCPLQLPSGNPYGRNRIMIFRSRFINYSSPAPRLECNVDYLRCDSTLGCDRSVSVVQVRHPRTSENLYLQIESLMKVDWTGSATMRRLTVGYNLLSRSFRIGMYSLCKVVSSQLAEDGDWEWEWEWAQLGSEGFRIAKNG